MSIKHTSRAPVARRQACVGRVPRSLHAQVARPVRVAIRRGGEVRDRKDSEANSEHDEAAADPRRSVEGRAEVADDQQSRCSGDLVGGRYPRRLAAGERESALDRRDGDADQSVDDHRLEERGETDEQQEAASAGDAL